MLNKITKNKKKIITKELVQKVKKLYMNKSLDEALELALEIISKNPKIPIIQNIAGIIYFNKNNLKQSLFHFQPFQHLYMHHN